MPKFTSAKPPKNKPTRPDKQGKVVIRVFLLDESRSGGLFPVSGNLKEDIFLEDTSVGVVVETIKNHLFESEESNLSNIESILELANSIPPDKYSSNELIKLSLDKGANIQEIMDAENWDTVANFIKTGENMKYTIGTPSYLDSQRHDMGGES